MRMDEKPKASLQNDVGKDRRIESFLYLYFLVSIGFILAVVYFISTKVSIQRQHGINLDVFCGLCIVASVIWMLFVLARQQNPTTVIFMDLPKRYTRPLLIVVYLFGISCIVTDTITLWTLVSCIATLYIQFAISCLKIVFSIVLILFLRKYSSASLLNASISLCHVLATCICLMIRTALGKTRPLVLTSMWTSTHNCTNMFTNPIMDKESNYIIAFDQEFYISVIVLCLVIWNNVKCYRKQHQTKAMYYEYQFTNDRNSISRDTSIETEVTDDYQPSQTLSEAVQKEPNIDIGLVFGLTIGAVLSIPYTFWWEHSLFTDKKIELYSFHMLLIVSMLFATVLPSIKLQSFPIPRISGIAFPITILSFLLLFCCTLHSWFSILALVAELQRRWFDVYETLAFSDHALFFVQVLLQTYLIIKAYSYCTVVLKPKSSNVIRQCVLFLMVCNFVLWLHLIYFDLNHKDHFDLQINFYGNQLWNIINKSTYPFCMFYRLFSSICLFEICFLF